MLLRSSASTSSTKTTHTVLTDQHSIVCLASLCMTICTKSYAGRREVRGGRSPGDYCNLTCVSCQAHVCIKLIAHDASEA
jgi:hypothetical protein